MDQYLKLIEALTKGTWKEVMRNGIKYYATGPHSGKVVGSIRGTKTALASSPKSSPAKAEPTVEETPLNFASEETARLKASGEYENARDSKVSNIGEDLKGSARHKALAWKGIAAAEKDGTAGELITRSMLLKNESPDFVSKTNEKNYKLALTLNIALERFPVKPDNKDISRVQYLESYMGVKNKAEELLAGSKDTAESVNELRKHVAGIINSLRAKDRYSSVANQLASFHNNTLSPRTHKSTSALHISNKILNEYAAKNNLSMHQSGSHDKLITECVKQVLEGKSPQKAFELDKKSGSGTKKFKAVDMYVGEIKRTGEKTGLSSMKEQVNYLTKTAQMRGIQWGNSVTDSEREHHLRHVAEAFKDLTDILELPEEMGSFNNKLGLAIGARGHGTALAHFEPSTNVINLTRKGGVGSLAHEWGHFFDKTLADTHSGRSSESYLSEHPSRYQDSEVAKAMDELLNSEGWTLHTDNSRTTLRAMQQLGMKEKASYWLSTREKFARAFEVYIQHKLYAKNRENTYLSGVGAIKKDDPGASFWPNKEVIEKMAPHFDKLFDAFRKSEHLKKAMESTSMQNLTDKLSKGKKEEKFFVSIVPVTASGEVLLGKRTEDGIWTTPGGGANPGEEPHQAARRELFEEAGLAAPANALELVNIGETPRGFKIYSFLWRMPALFAEAATPKLDPDKEVKSWKLYRPEDFPSAMAEEKNASRLKTIREALMKLYDITKAENDKIVSLTEKLAKGGEGSGVKGHQTPRERLNARLRAKGIAEDKLHLYTDKKHQAETSVGRDALGNDLRPGQESKRAWAGQPQTRDSIAQAKRKKELEKGGPGSGQVGHVTAAKPSPLHPHVGAAPANPINKLQSHLQALEHGGVVPGVNTQSGKPVVTNMDQAKAMGYDVQDHVDAMNAHYELAQKTQTMLEKFKMAGQKVPAEGAKIAQFHQKKMKEHMRARQYLEDRTKHTAEAIKEKKKAAVASVKKSVTQMGGGLGDRDINTGDFAQAAANGHAEWMEKLYSGMEGFQFADVPRDFDCPRGKMTLAKVDDGLYSGAYTKMDPSGLEDHARVRIERMTIPELVQFMVAQEWIPNPTVTPPTDTVAEIGQNYASGMDHFAAAIENQEKEAEFKALNEALKNPQDVPPGGHLDQKIRMLELISKLMS